MKRYNEQQELENYRMASIIAAIYNTNIEKFKRKQMFTPDEILGIKPEPEMGQEEVAEMWAAVMGGDK
jgi:hypothetical protein